MAPWLQSGWSPISPEALTLELGHGEVRHTQTVPVLGSVRAPLALGPGRLVLVPGESHEILLRNDTQETVRIAEIRMPAGFLVSEWVAGSAPDRPRKPLDSKSQMGCGNRAPEDWIGGVMGARRGTRRI